MFNLKFNLNTDYSGCTFTLAEDGCFVRKWHITYGYNTPEWQEKERQDTFKMRRELIEMGLDFDELNNLNVAI